MIHFIYRARIATGLEGLSDDLRSLTILETPGGPILLAAGGVNGGLISLSLDGSGAATVTDSSYWQGSHPGAQGSEIMLLEVAGSTLALTAALAGQGLAGHVIDAEGDIGAGLLTGVSGLIEGGEVVLATSEAGHIYVATSDGTVGWYAVVGDALSTAGSLSDTEAFYMAGLVDMEVLRIGGQEYLLALGGNDGGVTAFALDAATGGMTQTGVMGIEQGLGLLAQPAAMEALQISGRQFVIVASGADQGAGGALSVMELRPDGSLAAVDHVLDTLNTGFGQVQSLSVVQNGGWTYVLAAGVDAHGNGGVSLFTMLPDGRLIYLETIVEAAGNGLGAITSMTAVGFGEAIEVFLASQETPGLMQLSIPLGDQGQILSGVTDGSRAGGAGDDLLAGTIGANTLIGNAGDDLLFDGAGSDVLTGGDGRDRFVLEADGALDVITDFRSGQDWIDLSMLPMVYGASAVTIMSTSYGAQVIAGGEVTEVYSYNGESLRPYQIRNALYWGADRPPASWINEIRGSAAADTLTGTEGDDVLRGFEGADHLLGSAGYDLLIGGAGHDTLDGGAGNDTFQGGAGRDVIWMREGDDLFEETGSDGDWVFAGAGRDTLSAGSGDDRLWGGDGADLIYGNAGDDRLLGGSLGDTLYGGAGQDTVLGGLGRDLVYLGVGNDLFVDTQQGGALG